MDITALHDTAQALVAPGKGILAADESSGTIKKRFDSIGVESTESNRRDYREMLFTAEGAAECLSGVILYDETIRQEASDGRQLVALLEEQGIIPGIKVDLGAKPLPSAPGETITEGLDGLRDRLAEYRNLGARFAKWRATYSITDELPSTYCVDVNAHALARYAALCQEADIVPIVEPEVLMDGDHTIDRADAVTTDVLQRGVRRARRAAGFARGHAAEAEHGAARIRRGALHGRVGRGGRGRHRRVLPTDGARGGTRHRLPLGRAERRARHRPPRRNEPHGAAPLAAQLLVRPRAPSPGAQRLEGRHRERRRRPRRVPAPGPSEQCCDSWGVHRGARARGGMGG